MKLATYLIAVLVLSGCGSIAKRGPIIGEVKPALTTEQVEIWKSMIGNWYSNQSTKTGGIREALSRHYPDGTYSIVFKTTDAMGTTTVRKEVGLWGVSGDILFSIFRGHERNGEIEPANPGDPYNYDAYRITKLNAVDLEYVHVQTGNKFVSKKVASNFAFP